MIRDAFLHTVETETEDTPDWCAARTCALAQEFRDCQAMLALDGMLHIAFSIGQMCERKWWKMNHEDAAEAHRRNLERRREGQAISTEKKRSAKKKRDGEIVAAAKRLWVHEPHLKGAFAPTSRVLLERVQPEFIGNLKVQAISKILSKAKKAGLL